MTHRRLTERSLSTHRRKGREGKGSRKRKNLTIHSQPTNARAASRRWMAADAAGAR